VKASLLPEGTVTFLFTDIEGSTRLLHELGDAYADVLAEHRRVLRDAFVRHGGVEVDTQGDAFFVAFARASDALAAALVAQAGLNGPIRVRMGVHTGEPLVTDEGYVGIDVHRAARIAAAGHGGQVLVSQSTRDLVGAEALRDLGEHRLKDLTAPERIFQLGDGEFPPLKTLNATNLPVAANPLVGREREVREITALLSNSGRLVTLTGPGGTGKTRLALQAAAELLDDFPGGVFFVPLAGVQDAALVSSTITTTVGIHDFAELHGRRALLVLDNFEHVLAAAPAVSELVRGAQQARLLTTSRAPLRIEGEREYPVDPLPDPDAVALLTQRARAVRPDFAPNEATREICRRLDGLPLALELAASRLRSLGSAELLERLEQRLPVLTSGRRDVPERQRTLRATIEWSYDLLEPELQRLFARLGVFSTFALESAEEVGGATLDDVDALVEASLLKPVAGDRFLMLETIREFALERLAASGEEDAVRLRHAEHFANLGRRAGLYTASDGPVRYAVAQPELNNIRSALAWSIETRRQDLGLRIAGHLESYWVATDAAEGARWIEALLALAPDPDPALYALALQCLGNAGGLEGDPAGERFHHQSLAIWRELGRDAEVASLLSRLAVWAIQNGDTDRAVALLDESDGLNRTRRLGTLEAENLMVRGNLERRAGRLDEALEYYERSLEKAREAGFAWWEKNVLSVIAFTLFGQGRPEEALAYARDALEVARRIDDRTGIVDSVLAIARAYAETGDVAAAGCLLGAAEAEAERAPILGWKSDRPSRIDPLLTHEGPEFDIAREAGRELSLDDAVELALR
jgi:predicted ATPase/class 3 adenylate cyclase